MIRSPSGSIGFDTMQHESGPRVHGGSRPSDAALRRHPFARALSAALRDRFELKPGTPLTVGVSGGGDSVALLLGLALLQRGRDGGYPCTAVHVHHHLRPDADADADFVAALCKRLDVDHRRIEVRPADEPGNTAAAARQLRYAALRDTALSNGSRHVVVAHHADDQLETILMALGRGSGIRGLRGMAWRRRIRTDEPDACWLLRPLLGVRKATCLDFCTVQDEIWREDPTNRDPNTRRGRLRRDVLPHLESMWPDVALRATSASESLHAVHRLAARSVHGRVGPASRTVWPRSVLRELEPASVMWVLRRAAVHLAPEAADRLPRRILEPAARLVRSDDPQPRHLDWACGIRVRIDRESVRVYRDA